MVALCGAVGTRREALMKGMFQCHWAATSSWVLVSQGWYLSPSQPAMRCIHHELLRVKASSAQNAHRGSWCRGRSSCRGFKFHWHLVNAGRKGCHLSGYLCQSDDLVNCSEIGGTYNFSFMGTWDKTKTQKLKLLFIDSTCL